MLLGLREVPQELTNIMDKLGFDQVPNDLKETGTAWVWKSNRGWPEQAEEDFRVIISHEPNINLPYIIKQIYYEGFQHGQAELRRQIRGLFALNSPFVAD
jgi:hypothetical protein